MKKHIKKLLVVFVVTLTMLGCSLTVSANFAGNLTFTFVNGSKIGYSISEKSTNKINLSDLDIEYAKDGSGLYTHTYAFTNTLAKQRTVGNKILYINNDEKSPDFDKKMQSLRINFYLDSLEYPLYAQMINQEGDIVVSVGDKSLIYYNTSIENIRFTKTTSYTKDTCYDVEVSIKVDEFHMIIGNMMMLGYYTGQFTDISYYGASSVFDDDSTYITVKFSCVDEQELKEGLELTWYGEDLGTIKLK